VSFVAFKYDDLDIQSVYTVPDITAWIRIEVIVGAVQFVAFGVALGLIHARFG
jgi:hypothetical protein